jgi:hypothetical protein
MFEKESVFIGNSSSSDGWDTAVSYKKKYTMVSMSLV